MCLSVSTVSSPFIANGTFFEGNLVLVDTA